MAEITFTSAAIDDLRRLGPDAVPKVLKKILILGENVEAGYPLGGELTQFRKLVVGRNTWRVIYRITDSKDIEICEIWAIGARADAEVYREAIARVRAARSNWPGVRQLAEVIERLGRIVKDTAPAQTPPREPVPDWLADRLVHTVGMNREEVAALDLQQAVDRWTEFMTQGH